jgi:uncharacterized protein YukE
MPDVRFVYEDLAQLAQLLQQGAQQIEETARAAQQVAQILESGALLGQAGDNFANGLQSRLVPRTMRLSHKFEELSQDVRGAMSDMSSEDQSSAGLFS